MKKWSGIHSKYLPGYSFLTPARHITSNAYYDGTGSTELRHHWPCIIGKGQALPPTSSAWFGSSTQANMDEPEALRTSTRSEIGREDPHFSTTPVDDDDSSSSRTSIKEYRTFLTEGLDDFYVPIDRYEGRHRYDPHFRWEEYEEKKLVRKVKRDDGNLNLSNCADIARQIDLRICTWVCLTFFALQLDRAIIVQALSDNMLKDLHLNTNDYNTGQTIFYVSFLSVCIQLPKHNLGC
jgi:hypothetical protein